jgi:hypothetical protein
MTTLKIPQLSERWIPKRISGENVLSEELPPLLSNPGFFVDL